MREPKQLFQDLIKEPKEHIEGDYVWITDDWSPGYFHWMADSLPRLIAGKEELKGKTLLLPAILKDKEFVTASLKCLGVTNIEFVSPHVKTHVSRLTVIPHVSVSGQHNKAILQELRSRLRGVFSADADKSVSERLYVSRSKADRRRVINEAELIPVLKKYGFEVVHFEDLSWEEQAKKCVNAKYLIGPHGAGLVNMIFLERESIIFELFSGTSHNECFSFMARKLYLNYTFCTGYSSSRRGVKDDFMINPTVLEERIVHLLS